MTAGLFASCRIAGGHRPPLQKTQVDLMCKAEIPGLLILISAPRENFRGPRFRFESAPTSRQMRFGAHLDGLAPRVPCCGPERSCVDCRHRSERARMSRVV